MDKQNDTSNCNAESGFISPHKQPQTHPPLKNKTKLTKQNSTNTKTKKGPKKQQLQLHTNPNKEKTNRKTSERKKINPTSLPQPSSSCITLHKPKNFQSAGKLDQNPELSPKQKYPKKRIQNNSPNSTSTEKSKINQRAQPYYNNDKKKTQPFSRRRLQYSTSLPNYTK